MIEGQGTRLHITSLCFTTPHSECTKLTGPEAECLLVMNRTQEGHSRVKLTVSSKYDKPGVQLTIPEVKIEATILVAGSSLVLQAMIAVE